MSATHIGNLTETNTVKRRDLIARVLEERDRVSEAELVRRFGITSVSIQHDLTIPDEIGKLRRIQGGAVATSPDRGLGTYARKARNNRSQKVRIRAAAAALAHPGDVVIFDSGLPASRSQRMFPCAWGRGGTITVVTTSVPAIAEIEAWGSLQLSCLGGLYLPDYVAFVGPQTMAELRGLSADVAFLGCDGVAVETGLTTRHIPVAVADSTQLGGSGFAPVVLLGATQVLVAD